MAVTINPSAVIRFNKSSGQLERPRIVLRTRGGKRIGTIRYTDLNFSFVGKGLCEMSFSVHKSDNEINVWNKLIDLCIIEFVDYGQFEATFQIDETNETIKKCTAVSLETELGQRLLREFHINDDDAFEYPREVDLDEYGVFIPTVLYDENDTEHSLLHRALKDKAPHWSIGYVCPQVSVNGKVIDSNSFQRSYTVNGKSIYDFLQNDVAQESNVVFTFNTYDRIINVWNGDDCVYELESRNVVEKAWRDKDGVMYDKDGNVLSPDEYGYCEGIGEDTTIILSNNKLVNTSTISTNKDSIKNCFYVSGGDNVITNMVGAANITGNNYIYLFANFQYEDMSDELSNKLKAYQEFLNEKKEEFYKEGGVYAYTDEYVYHADDKTIRDKNNRVVSDCIYYDAKVYVLETRGYYDEDSGYAYDKDDKRIADFVYITPGLYTSYYQAQDRLNYLEHEKFPESHYSPTSARTQESIIREYFNNSNNKVYMQNSWTPQAFTHVSNTIENVMNVMVDERYQVKVLYDSDHVPAITEETNFSSVWSGYIKVTREIDENETYISSTPITVSVKQIEDVNTASSENLEWCKQKLNLAISKLDIANLDYENLTDAEFRELMGSYNLQSLKGFYEGFAACMSSLTDLKQNIQLMSDTFNTLYAQYTKYRDITKEVLDARQEQVDAQQSLVDSLSVAIAEFRKLVDMHTFIGDELWNEFQSYIREDTYSNSNYISDGLTDSEILDKCKKLLETAYKELSKACVIQKKISGDINNIFAIEELNSLHDNFALYNYIRYKVDGQFYKLRLSEISFSDASPEKLQVSFTDSVEYLDGSIDYLQNLIKSTSAIATSYNSTVKQAEQGKEAQGTIKEFDEDGVDATAYNITNSDKEMVIGSKSILFRHMNDDGTYDPCQTKLSGNGLYMTTNNWKLTLDKEGNYTNSKLAVGKIWWKGQEEYGVVADVIVGNLIAGSQMEISNDSSNVTVNGDGIYVEGGALKLTDNDGNYLIELDPNHELDTAEGYLISARKKNSTAENDIVFGIKTNGDAIFRGTVYANGGSIGGLTIDNQGNLTGGTIIGTTIKGGSIGIGGNNYNNFVVNSDGSMRINNKFSVSSAGVLNASEGTFSGTVTATSGSIGNLTIDAYGNLTGGVISGTSISGGTITGAVINNGNGTFSVNSNGELTSKHARFTDSFGVTVGYQNGVQTIAINNTDGIVITGEINPGWGNDKYVGKVALGGNYNSIGTGAHLSCQKNGSVLSSVSAVGKNIGGDIQGRIITRGSFEPFEKTMTIIGNINVIGKIMKNGTEIA